jgi:DNA-binding Lrp family transcriptional regulator
VTEGFLGSWGVSQPTTTRTRARFEKEFIETYTVIPDSAKLEYQLLAFAFIKVKSYPPTEEAQVVVNRASEWTGKHLNDVFAANGEGLGRDVVMLSFHKDYAEYSDFMRSFAMGWGRG